MKRGLILGLAIAIILDTAGQLLWKFASARLPQTTQWTHVITAILQEPYFLVVGVIFLCQLVNWLIVLEKADLSYAQPITSLSYVTVCGISALLFGEHIGFEKSVGIVCVLAGVWCLSQSDPSKDTST